MVNELESRHPIRVVAQRTGLTTATLRAWERRYQVVDPGRSEGGQRLYSDRDVLRLTRLRLLTEAGRSISSVAPLGDGELEQLLEEDRANAAAGRGLDHPNGAESAETVEVCYAHALRLDGEGLERCLRKAAVTLGAQAFLENVVAPLMHRVGTAWTRGEMHPPHEHLCTAVVERVLSWLTEPVSGGPDAKRIVVATLPGERHALGAMLVAAAAGIEGWLVTYLGTDLPPGDTARAAEAVAARAVAVSVVHVTDASSTAADLAALRAALPPATTLIAGGGGMASLDFARVPAGVKVVGGLTPLRHVLADIA